MMKFVSTRGRSGEKSLSEVLLEGLAPDGGLYVPREWPHFAEDDFRAMNGKPYAEIALHILRPFLDDLIDEKAMKPILAETYGPNVFNHPSVAPLVQLDQNLWVMELFRGPTLAFKDVALQLLGRLFDHVLKQQNKRITIVGATSGDTGSAAIEACRHCDNLDIFILHPKGRVSDVQRRQMTTIQAPNVHNIAVEGNFDDCQTMVKAMFADVTFRDEIGLSAINSINWARIMAQIVYYVTTSLALGAPDRPVSYAVPTGNFGNVYASWAARKMGLPIKELVISTNRNDILTRFFETGRMESNSVEPSLSPSMDIQISSNFERFLYELYDRDDAKVRGAMESFKQSGAFSVSDEDFIAAQSHFTAHRCDDAATIGLIADTFKRTGEVLDPHTAVGLSGALEIYGQSPDVPMVTLACAHPAKFPDAVEKAIGRRPALPDHMADLFDREETMTALPNDLKTVQDFVLNNRSAE